MLAVAAANLTKIFGQGDSQIVALKDAQVSVEPGEIVALMGPAGSAGCVVPGWGWIGLPGGRTADPGDRWRRS